jgi:hypothetical protein
MIEINHYIKLKTNYKVQKKKKNFIIGISKDMLI